MKQTIHSFELYDYLSLTLSKVLYYTSHHYLKNILVLQTEQSF